VYCPKFIGLKDICKFILVYFRKEEKPKNKKNTIKASKIWQSKQLFFSLNFGIQNKDTILILFFSFRILACRPNFELLIKS